MVGGARASTSRPPRKELKEGEGRDQAATSHQRVRHERDAPLPRDERGERGVVLAQVRHPPPHELQRRRARLGAVEEMAIRRGGAHADEDETRDRVDRVLQGVHSPLS